MRTVCVVTTNRSDYGRLKPVMEELRKRDDLQLQVVVGSYAYFDGLIRYLQYAKPTSLRHSLPWYLRARLAKIFGGDSAVFKLEQLSRMITADGYTINARVPLLVEGGTPAEMVVSDGFGLLALSRIFTRLKPDVVLINGDRFEILSVAIAAAYMNIPLAHIEGGDVSGTIDNSIRHAVSKLAHIHFPATEESAERLRWMGEDPTKIFVHGSPIIDSLVSIDLSIDNSLHDRYPKDVGHIDFTKPYVLVAHHPVTTEYAENYEQMKALLNALDEVDAPRLFLSPNIDAGSDGISVAMREYRKTPAAKKSVFHKHLSLEDYIKVFNKASVAIGNSSSFLREGAYLGVPCVLIGTRQKYRERGRNTLEVQAKREAIVDAMRTQMAHGKYPQDLRFGDGTAARRIAQTIATLEQKDVSVQKYFHH